MKKLLSLLILLTALAMPINHVNADQPPFLGEISIFAGTFAPVGWLFCAGQLLPIAHHSALFSLLGTNYGGDGMTIFALPDLREQEKSLKGARYIIALDGEYPSRH